MFINCGLTSWLFLCLPALASEQNQQPISLVKPAIIPALGFGTWRLDKSNASEAVSVALQTGYAQIDCAAIYGNEKEVGRGIAAGLKESGRKREDIWVTSKLWNDQYGSVALSIQVIIGCTNRNLL